ncbi:UDP glycosyltransferase [Solirubrobacter sp. CPCC 204708]|nr:UDP glycosyltransferase [Solirubrobacter deserti]
MAGVSAPSHIYPSLAVIAELVRRGHHVTYVVGERHRALVEPTGATVVGHETVMPLGDEPWPEDPGEAMQVFLDDAIATLPTIERLEPHDAVLYDIGGFAGHAAAHEWDVPAVQLSPASVAWEGYEEEMAEFYDALKASPSGARYFATLRTWLDDHGVQLDAQAFLGRPEACVVLIPRALQPNADRVSDRYVFAGPAIDEARRQGWTPPPGDAPLVYVSFGTAYTDRGDLYTAFADELSRDHRVVIATGKVDPAALPDTVDAKRTQPQLDVLEHADVFITHAGMGGANEALWYGVPVVAAPQAVDQFQNAATLEAIGAGVQLGDKPIREAVSEARACAPRVRELRQTVRAEGGVAKAADAVERLTRP